MNVPEMSREQLPLVPYTSPDLVKQEKLRRIFEGELLKEDYLGRSGAIYLPADHDGDEKPETLELVLTEEQVWGLYRDDILTPHREKFLAQTPSGQIISEHMAMVRHLGRWANFVRQFEQLVPLDEEPEPNHQEVATWAMDNLGLDIENAYRASGYMDADDDAAAIVIQATTKIDEAYKALQAATLILMAVPQLQIGHKNQALHVEDQSEGTWQVINTVGDGTLVITRTDSSSTDTRRRIVNIYELLAWNDLSFVPDQASGVHDEPENE